MLGYNEETSAENNLLLVGTFMSSNSLITVVEFFKICSIELTMGFERISINADNWLVGLLMFETMGRTDIGFYEVSLKDMIGVLG